MSRRRVDPCLICGELACVCGKKPKAGRQPKVTPLVPSAVMIRDVKIPKGFVMPTMVRQKQFGKRKIQNEVLVEIAALRNIEDMLHPSEKVRFHAELTSPPSRDERVAFWKARCDE